MIYYCFKMYGYYLVCTYEKFSMQILAGIPADEMIPDAEDFNLPIDPQNLAESHL